MTSFERLTPRQQQVLARRCAGRSNREIALELGISPRTVEAHLEMIKARMSARSMYELFSRIYAFRERIA